MPTTILDGETYEEARYRRFSEEAKDIYKMNNPEFESWWEHEGSSLKPALGEDAKEHAKRVAAIAWSNGDFCALAEQVIIEEQTNGAQNLVLAEREACAKVCEEVNADNKGFPLNAKTYAAAIRARSDK